MQTKTVLQKQQLHAQLTALAGPVIAALFGFALICRIVIGMAYYNEYDTYWYRDWAWDLSNGFFSVYGRAEQISLDYPPLYLFLLGITNLFYRLFGQNCGAYLQMLLMKLWPILADLVFGLLLYRLFGRKFGQLTGAAAAILWLFNPSVLFNSAFWGQTDGLLCMLLFVSYWLLTENRPVWASVLFAVAGLTKFQALFFLPIFLFFLWRQYSLKQFFAGIGAAAGTVLAVFLPFSIGARDPLLLFKVYLGGQNTYQKCTLNAFNVYGLLMKNWVDDSKLSPLGIRYSTLNTVILCLLCGLLLWLLCKARRRCIWTISFLWMNSLFLFTTRMHERYQFVGLVFLLAAALLHKNRRLLFCYIAISMITLINQAVPMLEWNSKAGWLGEHYSTVLGVFSLINLMLYGLTTVICLHFLWTKPPKKGSDEIELC